MILNRVTPAVLIALVLAACAHRRNIMPEAKDVQVRREDPATKCTPVGDVTGRTVTARGTREEALEDLKRDAANRGGNYVVIKEWSAYGTGVTGVAYACP